MPLHCGLLAGEVAICAGCNVVEGWAALSIGVFAGILYFAVTLAVEKAKLDDPVEAIAVHGGGGIAGIIGLAFLQPENGIFYNWDNDSGKVSVPFFCLFYSHFLFSFSFSVGKFVESSSFSLGISSLLLS